jgi:hypothetical protein
MKKSIFLLTFYFLCTSCSSTNYIYENKTQRIGVNFREGRWLLNEIDAPYGVEKKLNEIALQDFTSLLANRVIRIADAKDILLERKTALNPNTKDLKNLKIGTNFDYFINIKARNTKNNLGVISLTNHNYKDSNETNNNEVVLEIYDLNRLEIIFSQKVIASSKILENSSSDVHFTKSSNAIIIKSYKKLIKDLSKKSIK